MLRLFETGYLAYRCGRWRGLLYIAATLAPLALANFLDKVFDILPVGAKPPEFIDWVSGGFYCLAIYLIIYGIYRLYRDHVHGDHYLDADRYRREGR